MISRIRGVYNSQSPFLKQNPGQYVSGAAGQPDQRRPQNPTERVVKSTDDEQRLKVITAKLDTGKRLSRAELDFLRDNDLEKYRAAMQIQIDREIYERQMSKCGSKKEVREIRDIHMQMSAAETRAAKYEMQTDTARWRAMTFKDAYEEFSQTDRYNMLREDA